MVEYDDSQDEYSIDFGKYYNSANLVALPNLKHTACNRLTIVVVLITKIKKYPPKAKARPVNNSS